MRGVFYFVTERSLGPTESRVCRSEVCLRGRPDALALDADLREGRLPLRPGVRAWVEER